MTRTLLICSVLSLLTAAGFCGEDRPDPNTAPKAPEISAGYKAFVDPFTGEPVTHPLNETKEGLAPADDAVPPLEPDATHATSARGLREIASPEPGGGVSVDLEGRFRVPLEATVPPDRGPSIRHRDAPAAPETAH